MLVIEKMGFLTEHIEQCKEFTKEISIGPKVVSFEIGIKIVEQELLFLSLFCFTNDSNSVAFHKWYSAPMHLATSRHMDWDFLKSVDMGFLSPKRP